MKNMFRKTLCTILVSVMALGVAVAQDGFDDPDVGNVEEIKTFSKSKKSKRQLMLEEQEILDNQKRKEEQERNAALELQQRKERNRHADLEDTKEAPAIHFAPSFTLGFSAGLGSTLMEGAPFINTVVPTTQINVGYYFTPVWGARLAGSYGTTKSSTQGIYGPVSYTYRSFNFFGDALINLNNAFAGYKGGRPVEVYFYAGIGAIIGTENYHAGANMQGNIPISLPDHWTPTKAFLAGRGGLMMAVRATPNLQFIVDGGVTVSDDKLDSRIDKRPWLKATGQIGLAYNFDPFLHKLAVIERKANNIPYYVGLNLNFVDLGYLGTLNVGADINVSKHLVLGLTAKFNPWVFNKNGDDPLYDNKTMAYIGIKGYPWNIFDGWHFDAMAGWSKYRSKDRDKHPEEGHKFGAGVGFGYSYIINKTLNLEIGAGCWMGAKRFDTRESLSDNTRLNSGTKFFIEPYNISLGLTWVINPGESNKKVGNEKR